MGADWRSGGADPGWGLRASLGLLGRAGASVLTGVVASSACGKEDDGGWRLGGVRWVR